MVLTTIRLLIFLYVGLVINCAEISDEEGNIKYAFSASALNTEPGLSLSLSNLMRPLHESNDLGIANAEHGTSTGIFHDAQVALDLSHFKEFPAIHSQGACIIVVPQV